MNSEDRAVADAMVAAFDSMRTDLTWLRREPFIAVASFTAGSARVLTTFFRLSDGNWQARYVVDMDNSTPWLVVSIQILAGVLQAIREFLEIYRGVTVEFSDEELAELWAAHLRRDGGQSNGVPHTGS